MTVKNEGVNGVCPGWVGELPFPHTFPCLPEECVEEESCEPLCLEGVLRKSDHTRGLLGRRTPCRYERIPQQQPSKSIRHGDCGPEA
jgi:hypothetical protein